VRFQKLCGNDVVFVCADDTHGTPVELSALRLGITPEALVDKARKSHIKDYEGFNIGFDIFYSTNSEENRSYAELIYSNLLKHDLIVEREIDQYYCEKDKRFLPDRFITGTCPNCKAEKQYGDVCEVCGSTYEPTTLIEPQCIICGSKPVLKKSVHLYVKLDKCEAFLREFVETGVLQDDMKNFVKSWIDAGLKEWCISRDGPYFGFKIPGKEDKYFYVWLDAPVGYISSTQKLCNDTKRKLEDYWGENSDTQVIHFIGKDIVYFHALFWPVMLKNSGFKLPSRIVVHGFLNIQGEKMSKSRGTFILARDFLDKVNHPQAPEYLRFYFASKLMPHTADIDLNKNELLNKVNTTLANNLGNFHHRTFVFCDRYFDKKIPDAPWDEAVETIVEEAATEIASYYKKYEYKSVVEKIHALGSLGNKYYQDCTPWVSIKSDPQKAASVMVTCVNLIKAIAVFIKPITPELAKRLEAQLGCELKWDDYKFSLRNVTPGATEKLVKPFEEADIDPLFVSKTPECKPQESSGLISVDTFKGVDLRVGTILEAEKIEK
ncbi:MAG: methionine--tRNA ligase, partial [Fibrobacter sp.]|nr:methionine--tRNA ligase [Fibrobacter sp.]